MKDQNKKKQLQQYKNLATGLFLLMVVVFLVLTWLQKTNHSAWIGYVRAFAEAGMVGALADWFAVTALFHHPLGLKIPHTNLIENSKQRIGDNLGNFVVENFLSPQNIKPYIQQIKISNFVGDWLSKEKNQSVLMNEISVIALDIITKLEDESVVNFIGKKTQEMTNHLEFNQLLSNGIGYLVEKNEHQKLITHLSSQIKNYVNENEEVIRERVSKGSYSFIPKFIDNKLADKISTGILTYFEEIEKNPEHELRKVITSKLTDFSVDLKENPKWKEDLKNLKNDFLSGGKLEQFSQDIWQSLKKTILSELQNEDSSLKNYIRKNIVQFSENLRSDENLQIKIDQWIRVTAYRYLLKNTNQFSKLISNTVGNWQGKELSNKLELEVGKDLQFIRINGTLVGGLVGLIIYTIAQLI